MIPLRLEVVNEKTVQLTGLDPLVADCLQRLAEILAHRDAPAARHRLSPKPSADAAFNAEWEQFVAPDLHHLFVSAAETVLRDLTALETDPQQPNVFRVAFPTVHRDAWMSAINQARLILSAQFHVTDQAMERRDLDPRRATDVALVRIHLLGWVLEMLVNFGETEAGQPGPATD